MQNIIKERKLNCIACILNDAGLEYTYDKRNLKITNGEDMTDYLLAVYDYFQAIDKARGFR